jgi:hypothetical protein
VDFTSLKEGQDVWVGNRWSERAKLQRIVRVTPTRIVLDGNYPEYNTYKRVNSDRRQDAGYAYGRSWNHDGDHIAAKATKAERIKWDATLAEKAAADEAREAEQERKENLRQELSDLLPGKLYVQAYNNGSDGPTTSYGINGLTEAQVRRIAKLLKRA